MPATGRRWAEALSPMGRGSWLPLSQRWRHWLGLPVLAWLCFLPLAAVVLWLSASERVLTTPLVWEAGAPHACLGSAPCDRLVHALAPVEGGPSLALAAPMQATANHFLPSYASREAYNADHRALHRLFQHDAIKLMFSDGSEQVVAVESRGWKGIQLMLILHLVLASIAWTSGWVQVLLRRKAMYVALAIASTSYALGMALSGLEISRALAWPLGAAGELNHLARWCALMSLTSFIAFVLCLPKRFLPAWVVWGPVVLACGVSVLDFLQWGPSPLWAHQAVVIGSGLGLLGAVIHQWRQSKSPLLRALSLWLTLGAVLMSLRILLILALPSSIDGDQDFIEVSLLPFKLYWLVLMLASPALALADGWLKRLLLWALAALMLLLTDALLVLFMQQHLALLGSLMVVGLLYLPLRQWMMQALLGHHPIRLEDHVDALYAVARAAQTTPASALQAWNEFLQKVFAPESATWMRSAPGPCALAEQGVALWAPLDRSTGDGVLLRRAQGGRRLFGQTDVEFASLCGAILERLIAGDRAARLARVEERQRIANDLHDDLGGRLLHMASGNADEAWRRYAQETLSEMRLITHGLARESTQFGELLADLRAECMARVRQAGLQGEWHSSVGIDDPRRVRPEAAQAVARMLSEAVRNALTHGKATIIRVTVQEQGPRWRIEVHHDGIRTDPALWRQGLGTRSIQRRAHRFGGEANWQALPEGGTLLTIILDHQAMEETGRG